MVEKVGEVEAVGVVPARNCEDLGRPSRSSHDPLDGATHNEARSTI